MARQSFVKQLTQWIVQERKWWIIPLILGLLILGILMIVAEKSALAPFLYPLF